MLACGTSEIELFFASLDEKASNILVLSIFPFALLSADLAIARLGLWDQSQNLGRKIKINNFEGC